MIHAKLKQMKKAASPLFIYNHQLLSTPMGLFRFTHNGISVSMPEAASPDYFQHTHLAYPAGHEGKGVKVSFRQDMV